MGNYSRTYSLANGTTAYGDQVVFELDALGSSVNNIVNSQISSGAAISDSKLAQITTGSKVALSGLVQGGTGEVLLSGGGTADWGALDNTYMPAGSIIQTVTNERQTVTTGSTTIPLDSTTPLWNEGDAFFASASSITGKSNTNKWIIQVNIQMAVSSSGNAIAALFMDGTGTSASIAAGMSLPTSAGSSTIVSFTHVMTVPDTNAHTFQVRVGTNTGTWYGNENSSGNTLGAIIASSLIITEVKA